MADNSHDKLVEVVGKAPSREWIEKFFEYASELLSCEEIDHHEGDDRLVISVQSDRIAITMNSRYVLVVFFNKERIGFTVREGSGRIDDLIESAEGHYSFKTLQGEDTKPPEWIEFSDVSDYLEDDSIRQNWLTASSIEFERWSKSPYNDSHEPLAQRMVTDTEYRDEVLNEAFSSE